MHRSKARRVIPIFCEQLHPLCWWSARKGERNRIESTTRCAVIPGLCNVLDDHARNLDVFEPRTSIDLQRLGPLICAWGDRCHRLPEWWGGFTNPQQRANKVLIVSFRIWVTS